MWLLQRGGKRVEAEIVPCPLGVWLRVFEGAELRFGAIKPADERAALVAEADEQRRSYERRGYVAARPQWTAPGVECLVKPSTIAPGRRSVRVNLPATPMAKQSWCS